MSNISILAIREMPDSRWNEIALRQARIALEAQGVKPTPQTIKDYFATLRDDLEERWMAVEEVPVYAVSD